MVLRDRAVLEEGSNLGLDLSLLGQEVLQPLIGRGGGDPRVQHHGLSGMVLLNRKGKHALRPIALQPQNVSKLSIASVEWNK